MCCRCNRKRRDGGSIPALAYNYTIRPYLDPIGFWSDEIRHTLQVLTNPIGHELRHQQAIARAYSEGRIIDAGVARINDKYEWDR